MIGTALAQTLSKEKCKSRSNADPAAKLKVEMTNSYSALNDETRGEQSSNL